ncbi:MAG: polysulfide reductase NrfD [Krumholzibacteria bacterium]|nr:polysulfide reductase NrfD [Candidatus Krumholzibacteria bacterium]
MGRSIFADRSLIARGLDRAPTGRFLLWLLPWVLLAVWGGEAMRQMFADGLYHTNMDNRFAFGLWIVLDLAIIALGAGAFFLGFLTYLLRQKEMQQVISTAVIVGFACYSGAIVTLAVDVGQPIRAWFAFWHANVHSMLTEVTFCITIYLVVLAIEYLPIVLKNRRLRAIPSFLVLEFNLHRIMVVFAGIGAFLSFFHQGSLGGMFGVLSGRPFAFREGVGIWPSTFFLFILSAIAAGPSFIMLIVMTVQKLSRKRLVDAAVLSRLGRISGILLSVYVLAKLADTAVWITVTLPKLGFDAAEFYRHELFGIQVLFLELTVFGMLPATILLSRRRVEDTRWLVAGGLLACVGVTFNRLVVTLQTLSVPTLAFAEVMTYWPSLQEWAVLLGVVAYGVILYSLSFRYLNLFPRERELQEQPGGRKP